jgi:glycosyltransferase involved in cell wall biosynthesis
MGEPRDDRVPSLSVVIPVRNAITTLSEQLDAVLSSTDADLEVVVVDNGSTDGTRDLLAAAAESDGRLRVVDATEQAGEPYARNTGVTASRSPRIAFCDADDVVSDSWVQAMCEALADHEFVTGPVELDRLNPPWLAGFRGRKIYRELPTTVGGVPFAHGCNIGIQRQLVERLGGFVDPGGAGTDIDLAIRAWQAGVPLAWNERAVIHYRHRPRARDRWRQGLAYGRVAAHVHHQLAAPWTLPVRVRSQLRRARWLVATLPRLGDRAHRARWLWTLSIVVGELRGGGG